MKTLIVLIGVFSLVGCTGLETAVLVPFVTEVYKAGKTLYCENVTEEGKAKVKKELTDGKTLYTYCPPGIDKPDQKS